MDGSFIAAVNEEWTKKYAKKVTSRGLCYCEASSTQPDKFPDQNLSRCNVLTLTNQNAVTLLNVSLHFFQENTAFTAEILRTLIKFFYVSGEPWVMKILTKHSLLHPACCNPMRKIYRELFFTVYEDLGKRNLIDYVLKYLEDEVLKNDACLVNSRISRARRKKKLSDCFVGEEEPRGRRKQIVEECQTENFEIEGYQTVVQRGFSVLKWIVEIMRHDFYSKCARSTTATVDQCVQETLVGEFFFYMVDDRMTLNDDSVTRLLEIYRSCRDGDQLPALNDVIELIADCSWFVDSGKLDVDASILSPKDHSASFIFGQYFNHNIFKKVSDQEIASIIISLRPNWLRFNAAQYALKRWQKKHVYGLQSVILVLESTIRKLYKQETSSVLKTLNLDSQTVEMCNQITDELLSACTSNDVATLRQLSKTGDIDFQATDQSGCTILHLAAKYGSADCAGFLLGLEGKKANIDVKDAKGVTPFSYALQNYNTRVFNSFIEHGATPPDSLLGITEVDPSTYHSVFNKKLNPELSQVMLITIDSFISCFRLREIWTLYQEYKQNNVVDEPKEQIDYEFFDREVANYNELKDLIGKITRIKDCPVYVEVFKFL